MARRSTPAIKPIRVLWLLLLTVALALATVAVPSAEAQGSPLSLAFENARADVVPVGFPDCEENEGDGDWCLGEITDTSGVGLGAIEVHVLRNGRLVTSGAASRAEITLSFLSEEESRQAVGGIATFDTIRLDVDEGEFGLGTLKASSEDLGASTTMDLSVWEHVGVCDNGGDCSATVSEPGDQESKVSAGSNGGVVLASIARAFDLGCEEREGYQQADHATLVDTPGLDDVAKLVTVQIDRSVVQRHPNNGASFYQVCYASDTVFDNRDGEAAKDTGDIPGLPFGPDWLPDCPSSASPDKLDELEDGDAPCVLSRSKSGGDVIVKIALPPGDPIMR
jgi:hypothetical protein